MSKIGRRTLMRTGLAAGAFLAASALDSKKGVANSKGPVFLANNIKDVTLRFVGTGAAQNNDIKAQAEKDLGFKIQLRPLSTTEVIQIGMTQPKQFDIFDGEFFSLPLVVPSGNLQPIDAKRVKEVVNMSPIFTTGIFGKDAKVNTSQGTAPRKVMYLKAKDSTEFATSPTQWVTMIPFQYNADTLGYRPDLVGKKIESWAELFNPQFKGKTSLLSTPSIGIMDAGMVMEASNLIKFGDKGNMTREEIDKVVQTLIDKKKEGHFRALWTTFDESVNFMSSGEVVIQSMWSPAVTAVRAKKIPCIYAPLKEGYRGWGGGLGLSKNLSGMPLDAAYAYLDWSLSGWLGGFLSRQGYYASIPEYAKKFMKPEEWDFWYQGKPAAIDIVDPYGKKIESKGAVRDGGSYAERIGNIACWNSYMKEQEYLIGKWTEFVNA